MIYKVLIVDDSHFFQARLKKIIDSHASLQVVAIASNGHQAIEKEEQYRPDIITMDYEMPGMDGITALKAILKNRTVPIVMFSSMTYEGANITLDALHAGAVDYIPKNFAEVTQGSTKLVDTIHHKLIAFSEKYKAKHIQKKTTVSTLLEKNKIQLAEKINIPKGKIKLLVIGASTGGPVALAEIITRLPSSFSIPIIIAQHMPANFTKAFAERLNKLSKLNVKEAKDKDVLLPGTVFIAPGGLQTMVDKNQRCLNIIQSDERVPYKPSVDILFGSASNAFKHAVLGIILTGMGRDGYDGAKLIRSNNGHIWSQDKKTCVIHGMPGAVEAGRVTELILPIDAFYKNIIKLI